MGYGDCERCGSRVRSAGDHTCPTCAAALGRSTGDPWWGHFANHPDAATRPGSVLDLEARPLGNGRFGVAA